jgi:hypothetical protein
MAMMRSTGVLPMGTGDRSPAPEPQRRNKAVSGASTRRATGWASWQPAWSACHPLIASRCKRSRQPTAAFRWAGLWRWSTCSPGALEGGPTDRPDRVAGRVRRRRLRRRPDVLPLPHRARRPGSTARRNAHHVDRLGGLPRSPGPHHPAWPPSMPASRCSSPRTVWRPTTTTPGSTTPGPRSRDWPRPWPTGSTYGLSPLDAARQLRMECRLFQDVRSHRRRPHDLRAFDQALSALAGRSGTAQRPRLSGRAARSQRPSGSGAPSTSKPTRSMSGANCCRSNP